MSWACDADGRPLLVAGGINGIIRVIDAVNEKIHKVTFFIAQPFAIVVKNKDLIEIIGLRTCMVFQIHNLKPSLFAAEFRWSRGLGE